MDTDEFVGMVKVLYDHGYKEVAKLLARAMVEAAKRGGARPVPPEVEAFLDSL